MPFHNHQTELFEGLVDECPRCMQYQTDPTQLDDEQTRRLWRGEWKTNLDIKTFDVLYRAAVLSQRIQQAFFWEGCSINDKPIGDFQDIRLFEIGGRRA